MARFFSGGSGGAPFVLTPIPRALVVDADAPATAPDGSYDGNQAFAVFGDAATAAPDGGSVQLSGGDYSGEPPLTITDKSLAIICVGGRGVSPGAQRMDARLPDIDWSAAAVEQLFFFKCTVNLLGTDQISVTARDSVLSATGVGSLASFSLTHGFFEGNADSLSATDASIGLSTVNAAILVDCEIQAEVTAATSVSIQGCTFPFATTITSPLIYIDALSYARAISAGVSFSSPPVLLEGSDGLRNESLVLGGTGTVSDALNALRSSALGMLPIWCATTTGNAVLTDRYLYPGASETTAGTTSANQSAYIVAAPVTITGLYFWFATVAASPLATADCTVRIRKNGVDIPGCTATIPATMNYAFTVGLNVPLVASDHLQAIMQTTAADATVVRPRAALSYTVPA